MVRNKLIFDNKSPTINSVSYKSLGLHQNWKDIHPIKGKTKTLISPFIAEDISTGWCDGASEHNRALSGACGMIRINENSLYKWTFNCGPSTNTREELLGSWDTLHLRYLYQYKYKLIIVNIRILVKAISFSYFQQSNK
jgi:hypothetical protein